MVTTLNHLNCFSGLNPTLQLLGRGRLVKQRGELHAEATHVLGTFVHLSEFSQRLVWLYRVPITIVWVDVGQFAAVRCQFCLNRRGSNNGDTPNSPTRHMECRGPALTGGPRNKPYLLPGFFVIRCITAINYQWVSVIAELGLQQDTM